MMIMDVSGKVVHTHRSYFNKGYNKFDISADLFQSNGIFYYQISGDNYSSTKKMLVIP